MVPINLPDNANETLSNNCTLSEKTAPTEQCDINFDGIKYRTSFLKRDRFGRLPGNEHTRTSTSSYAWAGEFTKRIPTVEPNI